MVTLFPSRYGFDHFFTKMLWMLSTVPYLNVELWTRADNLATALQPFLGIRKATSASSLRDFVNGYSCYQHTLMSLPVSFSTERLWYSQEIWRHVNNLTPTKFAWLSSVTMQTIYGIWSQPCTNRLQICVQLIICNQLLVKWACIGMLIRCMHVTL